MAYVQGMCPECGGMLAVDDTEKASICLFCGKAFIVKEAIEKACSGKKTIKNKKSSIPGDDFAYENEADCNKNNPGDDFADDEDYYAKPGCNSGDDFVDADNSFESASEDFVIENGVLKKYVGSSEYVAIPKGVLEIGEKAFFNCDKIKSITFPRGVEHIGEAAFQFCEGIKSIELPKGLKTIDSEAFSNCMRLKSIVIPKGVTDIGSFAFNDCVNLESIVIPEGVTEIKHGTFSGCTHLEKITIPDSLERIGERCFEIGSKPKCVYVNSVDTWKNIRLGNFTDSNPLYPVGKLYVKGVLVTD